MRLFPCEERSCNYSLCTHPFSTWPRSFPCNPEASTSGIKRSLLAVLCQNKTHPLTSWGLTRTPYFTINNLARCPFTLELSIAHYHPTKIMLETQTPQWLHVTASFCNKFKAIKLHAYVCAQKQKSSWWCLPTALLRAQDVGGNSGTVSVIAWFQHKAGWFV